MATKKKVQKEPKTIKRPATQEDLNNNPELVEQGVQVGDEIEYPESDTNDGATYTVAEGQRFRDRDDFDKIYEAGEDVSHFDAERLAGLVENKLVNKA